MNDTLQISEIFYSIQGEGQTQGVPSIFIRLTGCNLTCGISKETFKLAKKQNWGQTRISSAKLKNATWVCDTHAIWMKGNKKKFKDVLDIFHIEYLKRGAHLIITGGEPLLHSQSIIQYLYWLRTHYDVFPTIEIETNGTIIPDNELIALIDYWNVSPKLKNSGMVYEKRINELALYKLSRLKGAIFKFVISQESDWIEIMQDFEMIDFKKIWLMPAAETREELIRNSPAIVKLAISNGLKFSNRLQLMVWNKATGV